MFPWYTNISLSTQNSLVFCKCLACLGHHAGLGKVIFFSIESETLLNFDLSGQQQCSVVAVSGASVSRNCGPLHAATYPAAYGQFAQALTQQPAVVPQTQREGKPHDAAYMWSSSDSRCLLSLPETADIVQCASSRFT